MNHHQQELFKDLEKHAVLLVTDLFSRQQIILCLNNTNSKQK